MRARGRSWSALAKAGEVDKRHGARVRYANPMTGGWVMPTMGAHLALLPAGFKGEGYRATDGTIFVCVEGEGATTHRRQAVRLERRRRVRRAAVAALRPRRRGAKSVLFSISDRPAQEALGIWREIN